MSTVFHLALNHCKAPLSHRNLVSFSQPSYSHQRTSIEIVRYARWPDDALETRDGTQGVSTSHILCSAISSSGFFPSSAGRASSARIQPGWRQVRVECICCGVHTELDRYSAIELWRQTSQILRSLHREGCEYANSSNLISGSSISAEEGMHSGFTTFHFSCSYDLNMHTKVLYLHTVK